MYICPNCAGHLKYDITDKKISCESCGSKFEIGNVSESKLFSASDNPYGVDEDFDDDSYSTYVYSCPQCGGEITCDTNEAATFCLYCGASNVLEGRLSKEKKPDYILPFSVDKEKCKNIYSKFAKTKLFAPSDILKEGSVDGFRGIYMPFWVYNIEQKGKVSLKGEKKRYSSNYTYYDEYRLTCELNARYEGLMYDASSSFYDDYSQCISPFDMKEAIPFDSSYIAGFYADTYDVFDNVYSNNAEKIAATITYNDYVKKEFKKIPPITPDNLPKTLNSDSTERKSALLPVWFMSYKYKDRMLYSVINGQTGEIAADVPISIPKYIIGSIILFVPIFIVLNMILSLNGPQIAAASSVISIIIMIVYAVMSSKLRKIESKENDKGYVFKHPEEFNLKELKRKEKTKKEIEKEKKKGSNLVVIVVLGLYLAVQVGLPAVIVFIEMGESFRSRFFGIFFQICCIIPFCINMRKKNKNVRSHKAALLLPFFAGMMSAMMLVLLPVRDVFYYLVSIFSLIAIAIAVIDLVGRYNELISRPMPQFKRKGGDDNA